MLLRTQNQAPWTSPLVIEAACQRFRRATQKWYLGGHVNAGAKIMPGIKRRFRLAWECYKQVKRDLYDTEAAPFTLKVHMLKIEGMTNC